MRTRVLDLIIAALTRADRATLRYAIVLERKDAGIGPRGAAQWRQYRKLARRKLLKPIGWGRDIAAESIEGRDLFVYELTVLGRRVATAIAPTQYDADVARVTAAEPLA